MKTIRTILQRTKQAPASAILAFTFVIAGWPYQSQAQEAAPASQAVWDRSEQQERTPATQMVWQHVGRVYFNPNTGKALYVGYLVHINGIDRSLFDGSPGETTAYFTFSTDVLSLTPLPKNGDVSLALVSAGTYSIYYNSSPKGDWNDPDSFSSGRLIATFARKESFFPQVGPIQFHSLSETLASSRSFTFDGRTFNFNRLAPHGVTFAQFFSATPQHETIADYPLFFAGAGTTVAIGGSLSARGPSTE